MTAASFILEEGSVGPFRFCWALSRDRGLKKGATQRGLQIRLKSLFSEETKKR